MLASFAALVPSPFKSLKTSPVAVASRTRRSSGSAQDATARGGRSDEQTLCFNMRLPLFPEARAAATRRDWSAAEKCGPQFRNAAG
jgi:hypothetical protein